MNIESAIYTTLTGDATLTALVAARVYPGTLPQNVTLPAIKWERTGTTIASAMSADTGPYTTVFQFMCVAEGTGAYLSTVAMADAVKGALVRLSGTISGTVLQDSFLLDEDDGYEDDPERYSRLVRIEFHHEV